MANLFQVWDEDIQALGAAKASDQQIEARRQQLAEHFKAKAKASGLSSKKIYETLDQFDTYSRQNSTNEDNRLTPEEEEMAQRVKDGTTRTGAMLEVGKRFKDVGLGVVSSLTRMGGDIAQTWSDVGDNDKSELSAQAAQGLYNITDDIRSNYSQGTKTAKKDFWSPEGLTMGLAENAGQIAGTAALLGTGGALAGAAGVASKAGKLLAMGTMAAPLAYSQGYGQGKESSLDEINKTSNAQLWENVKAEAKAYDDAGGIGEVPYLVQQFKEAGGDINLMKDLMAENAGNRSGIMTVGTEPLAMGVGSVMSRGAAAGGTGVMAKFANAMNNQGMSNELARRIAAGASAAEARKAGQIVGTTALRDNAAIASQAGKIAATQMAREGVQETAQEGLEGYYAKGEGSRAAGRKGELNSADWSGENGIVQQGLQGGAIGLLMGAGGAGATLRNSSKLALEKNGLPEKHDAAITAHEQAIANLEKATQILDLNPEDVKAQEVHAKAYDEALVATNNLEQLTGKFNALYTPEEQEVIKAKTMEGVAARAKVAEDAAKAQKELDAAQAKATQEQQAQQNEIIKAQRDEAISRLVPILGDDVAVSNELASLGLSEEDANTLLTDAHKEAKAQKKAQKKAGQQNQSAPKTPFELAVDEAFDVNGNRNKVASQDIADKHGIKNIKTLIDAISERIDSNATKTKTAANEALAQKRQADKQQAEVLSEKQQLENTLADFARNNDHDSMVNFLRDYDPKEADTLIANAYKAVDKETKAAQDAVTANQKAEALKAKQAEDKKSAEQKKIAFNQDMADLYAANPDRNPTKAELDSVGKKHGVKSPIELAQAWVKAKNEAKAAKEAAPKLALPSPETATKDERDITVPTGLNINRDNIENQDRRPVIVRNDGQPFQTQAAAEQALKNKSTKKPRKNEAPITPETHEVIPVDGGFAIAPVVEIQQPKKPDDNEDGGVIADTPKPNAPVSPTGQANPINVNSATIGTGSKDYADKLLSPAKKALADGNYSEHTTKTGEKIRLVIAEDNKSEAVIFAFDEKGSRPVATMTYSKYDENGTRFNPTIEVDNSLRRQGIATAMYKLAEQNGGLIPDLNQKGQARSDDGQKFRESMVAPEAQIERKEAQTQQETIEGEYQHNKIESAKATVSKTDKGYDVDWGDEVQSFNGKNAADNTQAALKKEDYAKQGQEAVVTPDPIPEPTTQNVIEPAAQAKTTGEQISEAMDKTATAITEASHNKVVERIRKGEEIVYKKPDAIERAKQDDRYQVEINDKGHAVVKNIKDSNGEWVRKKEKTEENNSDVERIAALYAAKLGHPVSKRSREFASDILSKNAYGLEFIANGMNDKGKEVFSEVTGVSLPKQQGATWKAIRDWAGVSDEQENHRVAMRDVAYATKAFMRDNNVGQDVADKNKELIASKIAEGFNSIEKIGNNYWFTDGKGQGINLSEKPKKGYLGLSKSRALIEAMIAEVKAAKAKESNTKDKAIVPEEAKQEVKEAVHIENGKAEEVTPEIIRESLAKVDDKPVNGKTMSLKEAKQWLLGQVSTAIAVAPANKLDNKADDLIGLIKGLDTPSERAKNKDKINTAKKELESYYITFDVPNDGVFKVLNNVESLQKFKKQVEANRGFDKQSPKKLFPSVSQNSADTTIAEFLSDGEVENAYEFAKLQDKPIRFGAGQLNGKPIALAYAFAESVDLGGGFKGFVGLSLDQKTAKKEWMFIEENSRLSIGFGSLTKQGIIKEAKERLAQLSGEQKANLLKNSPKSEKTDAEFEQQWLSQIGYNPNQNDDNAKGELKSKNEQKQNNAIADDILNQQPKENTVAAPAEKTTEISDEAKAKTGIIKEEYPTATVLNGWQNSSRNVNELVRSFKRAYEDYINEAYNGALSQAETDAQKKVLERESLKLQKEYIKRVITLAKVRSGVTSSFIAGGSNFNNKQAQNRSNAFDKASRDFENWLLGNKYTLSTAVQEARSPEQLAAIQAEKDAKAQRLQDKNDDFLRKVLSFKKGDDFTIGKNKVVRVNVNKYGMPISLTLEGEGIAKGIDDKVSLFGGRMTYETVDDLKQNIERVKEADSNAQAKDEAQPITSEPVSSVSKMQNAKAESYLNSKRASEYGEISIKELIDNRIRDGWTLTTSWKEDKAAGKKLDDEFASLRRNAPWGNKNHPDTKRLNELEKLTKGDTYRDGNFFIKEETYYLDSPSGKSMLLNKTTYEYAKTKAVPTPEHTETKTEQATEPTTQPVQYPVGSALGDLEELSSNINFDSWVQKHGIDENMARSILDTNVNNRLLSGLITHDLPPSDELLKFQDESILTYYRAKSEDVKSLSDEAFNLLLSQDDNNEKTGYFAYNILRYSNKQAELDYVSSLGAMNNRFRLDAQKYGGKLYKMAEPYLNKNPARKTTPVTQPESKPTPIASTSSSDLTDEEYIALKKTYNDFKAKTDKIGAADSRDDALKIATGLVAEMPDKEDMIRQALIDAIRENQWNRFEINFPKQPIKVETDAEINRTIKRLQKALEGTEYSINGTFNGKSAKLLFSYKSGANGSRESVLIDRVNGKFTSYHVDFDNMSREVLKPLMDATVKWLNGEEIPKMKLGDDSQWDYTTLLSTPRHIDNAFNEAKANAPTAEPVSKSDKLAQSFDEAKAKQQPTKEEAPKQEANSKTPTLDKHNALMDSVRDGKATAEDFKQSFADISANKDAILLELNALTKDQLLKEGGYAVQYRHKNDKKSEVAEAVYHSMIAEYSLGSGITYGMGKNSYENAVQKMVDNTDQQQLDEFAKEYKQMIDGRIEKLKAKDEALKNPTTLNDFRELMRSIMAEGKSRQEAFLSLSAEHRIKYDELEAESTKEARETRKRAAQASINTSSQTTDGKIIETKHTRDGYDLFVVQLSDRLSTDDYKKVLSEAKKLGGWYSSYKGGGAIVGFQFKDKEAAQAFLALAGGDTTAAKEQLSQKQDDYEDNRSQSAAERLLDMAEKIETKANEELDRDRKANTARRARFAMSAENEARAKIALAKTMRNIAEAIKNGKAKFLDNIRMKVDVEALRAYITTAKDNEIRSEYDSYAEQVKRKGQPATAATADFATYPTYTLFRSDLAFLGRQLLEIDGLKKLGQQIMAVADDVSDAYLEFAKKNLDKVSRFQTKDSALATFSSKETAERAIKKSGLTGKAIVLQVKRGENIVILSPSEAINLKVWEGDADKRITLKREFGNQLVESVGRRAGKNNRLLPYQFQYAYDKLKALSRIGIETPSEFRSALREFIALQEEATNNKVREMEMAMVGRKKDGLDFFPTPQAIAQQMIDSAEITPDMAVLEPSAGMGHIADMIRATGAEPDVIEMSGDRRELLQEKGYHLAEVNNFMNMQPREFFTYGDVFVAPDGKEGIMVGVSPGRVRLEDEQGNRLGLYNRDELTGVAHRGSWSGYDRIIMNPPFSNRQDAEHVRHAYELLRPNGRIVAIMGEGVFFGSDKKAVEFREWLESVGGTSEKLPDNSFMDSSLPVNTGVNARMVIIDKQDNDNQTNEDKPKFSRKATESDSVPIYRIDNKNFDANNIKPHGLYVSIPSDVSTFDSPHKDVGDTSFAGNASPKNPLNVESFKIQHKRGNDYPMEVSAGVSALKQLVSVQLFERLIKADKAELTATIKEQFPDIDTSQYYDAYELLEVLGAQLAIQEGYDAIIQKNDNDPFNEMVILDNSIIESMSPTDKPKFSRGEGEGLTTTQTRAILVKYFGEKLIKALESSGLLTIMATPPSWAKPDADGAYRNGKAYLFTDNLSAETVVATLAHELSGHKGFQEMMTPTAYASLMRQFNRLVNQGNAIALAAKARAEAAEVVTPTADTKEAIALAEKQTLQRQQDELLPYLLTLQATLNATRSQQSAVTKVIEQVYRAVKAWLYRTLSAHGFDGVASKLLQPKDITLLAERMIREMGNGTNPSNNTKAKGSQFSKLNTPQTQINAVRKKYEGTSQWMKAPNGQPTKLNEMQWLQVRTPNFKAWFGDWENDAKNASKVVDSETKEPMVVYRADTELYNKFDKRKARQGFFFTSSRKATELYNGDVRDFFLSIKNPLVTLNALPNEKNIIDLKNTNFDGVHNQGVYGADEFIVATSTQIKSATGNTGEFNPTNPDIRFSRKAKNPITEGIKSAANDAKNSLPKPISGKIDHFLAGRRLPSSDLANIVSKTELSIYKRTIGTQLNTALQLPDFKKVYDMAQRYLQHVAVDAYAALKVAPNLLGKLESWSDLKRDVKKIWPANFIKQKADRAAVASIIFDETLNNELLSDADILKALTRDQRQIYKEARDAIQVSLENTAKSEMVRKLLAAEAINWTTVESLMDKNLPADQFAQSIRDLVESRIGGLSNELEAILDSDKMVKKAFKTGKVLDKDVLSKAQRAELKQALFLKEQIETTKEALKSLNDVENRLGTLIEQGYAPLMRFGEYTLTVKDLDGKVKSFFMFESKSEQVRAVNTIVARYGKTVNLETDMISKEEFKQFAGMTPETVALFAKETGMDKDEAYQHYLKLAIPARSAMTRMIKRKGTEGFSDDIQRVVASFVMSNARMSAKNIYAAQIEKSIQDIESGKSVKDQAIVMKENVFNPKENSAQLRNILFLWNLGGSIFFGLLNMTQPYMQTLPHLSQYVPIKEAFDAIIKGSGLAGSAMKNGTAPKGYEAEYNRAVREGVVDPQNVFMLSGVERGKTGASNSAWGVITHTMGLIAQVTESFNRKAVFIAALEVANKKGAVWLKKKGFNSAYDFAKDTVDQTQGVYDKANRSNWANTSVGAPLMVFKQFGINYVEQIVRMWRKKAESGDEGKKAVFLMLAMLASLSGVMGLPFIKDFLDVSETTAAYLGHPVNIEREARLVLGKDLADPLFNGVLNHFVFNQLGVDTQSRTGMPDLLPWTNIANPTLKGAAFTRELMGLTGATGGLINKVFDSAQLAAEGNVGAAAKTLAPRFLTSFIDGGKMALTDEVMDSKGNKLFDTTWDEGLIKAIDATPKRMADYSRTKSLEWKDRAIQTYKTDGFKQRIIKAMMDKDQDEVKKIMKEVDEWNTSRPKYPVFINLNTLSLNANKKDQTFDARESIPKGQQWWKAERPEM